MTFDVGHVGHGSGLVEIILIGKCFTRSESLEIMAAIGAAVRDLDADESANDEAFIAAAFDPFGD